VTETFHARHAALFESKHIDEKSVLIIGAGSVGSQLAVGLGRAGIRHFRIVDFDTVSLTNLCRTVYRERDVGKPKVDALRDILTEIRKNIRVDALNLSLSDVYDEQLLQWIEESDLVVGVTDHPPTQGRLAALSYPLRSAVFSGVYAKGEGGEVLFTLPNETPCYHCVLGSIRGEHQPDRGKLDYGLTTGQLASEPALGADILHVTVCATKVALALLLRGTQSEVEKILDPARSVLFVGNTRSWIWNESFETVWARAERRTNCICRLETGDSTAVLLNEASLQ
jgi:molybdopterin/thiamine biosynthesis adenylyltransferase